MTSAPFRMGDVLVRSGHVLSRHVATFILLVGLAELPPLILKLYLNRPLESNPDLIDLLEFVLSTFAEAIVVFAAFQDLRGRPVSAAESLNRGVARAIPAFGASLLAVVLTLGGVVLCIVPGLIAMAAYCVVMPSCVVEGLGPIASLKRSAALSNGQRWPIAGVAIAWLIMSVVVDESIMGALPHDPAAPVQLLRWIWTVLSSSYYTVFTAILYHDLRAAKESIGIEEIASVFD